MLKQRGGGDHNDFDFGTFIGRFLNVGAASMAVKGLITRLNNNNEILIKREPLT